MRKSLSNDRRLKPGFTLIELLVVISIIALLVAILLPALAKARHSTVSIQCRNQLRQIALAGNIYGQDHKMGFTHHVWTEDLLSYVGINAAGVRDTVYTCAEIQTYQPTIAWNYNITYSMNYFCTWDYNGDYRQDQVLNPTSTMYILDGYGSYAPSYNSWAYSSVVHGNSDITKASYPHFNGLNVVYLDGHAELLPDTGLFALVGDTYNPFWWPFAR